MSCISGLNINLGMVPGDGRLPAEKIRDHVVGRLEKFGLNYKTDIINGTNDGCNTMIKYGDLLKILIQLCLAHGFQLGIVKTIYVGKAKKDKAQKISDEFKDNSEDQIEENDVEEFDEEDVVEESSSLEENMDQDDDITYDEDTADDTGLVNDSNSEALNLKGIF